MKRALLAVVLLTAGLGAVYGYSVTRQERIHRYQVARGDAALASGDTFAALEAFSEAVALRPDSMVGYLKRGEAHRRRGDLEAAAGDLRRAAALDSASPRALELLGDVESAREGHDVAAEHYAASARLDDRPRVLFKLGLARHLSGETAAAAETLSAAVALDSRFAEAHYLLGVCLRELGRVQEAEQALKKALALSPRLLAAREQLADLYGAAGRRAARIVELERLLAEDGGPARQITLAMAYAGTGQTSRAVRLLRRTAERHPDYPGTYLALGRLWLDVADGSADHVALDNAMEVLQQAVAVEPSGAAYTELARAHLAAGETAPAADALRRAIEALPADPQLFLRLAETAGRRGQRRAERDALVNYCALASDEACAHGLMTRIGDLSMRLGEPRVAARWYGLAAADARAAPAALVKLAEAHRAAGDLAAARAVVALALQREPHDASARALERRLR